LMQKHKFGLGPSGLLLAGNVAHGYGLATT
jgi:hypothetical protein